MTKFSNVVGVVVKPECDDEFLKFQSEVPSFLNLSRRFLT